MCVGLAARVEEINDGIAKVSVSGAVRDVPADFITGLKVGDYVMIHAGIAIARITAEEAEETQAILKELYDIEH
jgi:hydrogenase expression/formation protein HypC